MSKMLFCVFAGLLAAGYPGVDAAGYVTLFRDDFNGNTIDQTKWNLKDSGPNIGNEELQCFKPDHAFVNGSGFLYIKSDNIPCKRSNGQTYQYTSGRIDTMGKWDFTYGEIEFSVKLPKGKGFWPALWTLYKLPQNPIRYEEIDVLEAKGDCPTRITCSVHYPRPGTPPSDYAHSHDDGVIEGTTDFTTGFHKFKAVWDKTKVAVFVDGVERWRTTVADHIPRTPQEIRINTSVGGKYPGSPDATTPFPSYMIVDYVIVKRYQA